MGKFLLQLENNGHYSEDVAIVERLIREQNWLHPSDEPVIFNSISLKDISKDNSSGAIPVGSIEFVNKVLDVGYNQGPMKPINIPQEILTQNFLKRKVKYIDSKEEIAQIFNDWQENMLFIKSSSKLKADYTDIYRRSDIVPDDTKYFVSEVVDFVSEWRCFVYRGKLVGMKDYCGDVWTLPNKELIEDAIRQIGDTLTAYTLDVGVMASTGETAVIEVHNFVSCGLYGCDDKRILPMLKNGFKREISR